MPVITIRGLSVEDYKTLKILAIQNGCSLEEYMRTVVSELVLPFSELSLAIEDRLLEVAEHQDKLYLKTVEDVPYPRVRTRSVKL